jgi:hypothetical protein
MKNLKKSRGIVAGLTLSAALLFTLFTAPEAFAQTALSTSLDIGSRGSDVTSLQTFLAQDATIYPGGLVTGYYGSLTAAAVSRFQTRYGISAVGRVGPQTRAKINELIASGGMTGTGTSASKAPYIFSGVTSLNTPSGSTGGLASSSVAVSWQTDEPARGRVFYSLSPFILTESSSPTMEPGISGVANIMTDDTYSTSKTISLNNLWTVGGSANSYYYMIEAIDANGNVSVTWPRIFNSTGTNSQ